MVGFSRLLVFSFLSGVGVGCEDAAQSQQGVPPLSLESAFAIAPELTYVQPNGNPKAIAALSESVAHTMADVSTIVATDPKTWVAGDKANLIASGEPFLLIVEKSVAESWQLPKPEVESKMAGDYANLKNAAKILVAFADAVDEGGNPELAVRALLAVRAISARLLQCSNHWYPLLIADAIDAIAEMHTRKIVIRQSMSSEELKLLQGRGYSVNQSFRGLENTIRGEWTYFFVPAVATVEFPPKSREFLEVAGLPEAQVNIWSKGNKYPFDRFKTLSLFAPYFSVTLDELKANKNNLIESKALLKEIVKAVPQDESKIALWAQKTPNSIGLLIGYSALGIWDAAFAAAVKCEASRGLSEVVVAAQRGLAESGALPKDMAELRKFGLPAHVKDAYSGKEFLYDPVRGIAWSVGPDGKDDGGNDPAERWVDDAKDRVVRVK